MATTVINFEELRIIETMATIDEFAFGERLTEILKTRKELAKQFMKHRNTASDEYLNETIGAMNYCNKLVCEVLGIKCAVEKI